MVCLYVCTVHVLTVRMSVTVGPNLASAHLIYSVHECSSPVVCLSLVPNYSLAAARLSVNGSSSVVPEELCDWRGENFD